MKTIIVGLLLAVSLASGQWLEATIDLPAGAYPVALCYNSVDNKVYCANWSDHSVTIIDSTNTVKTDLPLSFAPLALCYNPANDRVYCAGNGIVMGIDGRTNRLLGGVTIPGGEPVLCLNPIDNKIYCGGASSGTVYIIWCDNDSVSRRNVANGIDALCFNPTDDKVYIACKSEGTLTVLRGSDDVRHVRWYLDEPRALCYGSVGDRVYCIADKVMILDGATNLVVDSLLAHPAGDFLGYNSINGKLYLSSMEYPSHWYLDIWLEHTRQWWGMRGSSGPFCHNPINNKVYVAMRDVVCVVDGTTNSLDYFFELRGRNVSMVHAPPQDRVYVANQDSGHVAVIRDSIVSGVEERSAPDRGHAPTESTVLHGILGVQRLAASVVYDVQGRRVGNPKAGVYFIREQVAGNSEQGRVRKVVVTGR